MTLYYQLVKFSLVSAERFVSFGFILCMRTLPLLRLSLPPFPPPSSRIRFPVDSFRNTPPLLTERVTELRNSHPNPPPTTPRYHPLFFSRAFLDLIALPQSSLTPLTVLSPPLLIDPPNFPLRSFR